MHAVDARQPRGDAPAACALARAGAAAGPRPLLSVIIPAFNEGRRITPSLTSALDYLTNTGRAYEILVDDDGSTDDTAAVVTRLAADHPCLRLLSYPRNRGKGYAVRTGVAAARGEYLVFTDADLTVPITIVGDLLAALRDGYDMAIASRWHPASSNLVPPPVARRVMGAVFRWCVRRLVTSAVRDTQCGCKAYRADVARRLFAVQRIERFSFDAEVIYLAMRAGYRIKEVPFALRHAPGSSVRPLRDALLMLRDLVHIRLNAARGQYPAPGGAGDAALR